MSLVAAESERLRSMSQKAARPTPVDENASSFSVSSDVRPSWSAPMDPSAQPPAKRVDMMEPEVNAGAPVLKTLPESYMADALTVLTVGPDRIVVYWDARPETMRIYEGARWELVVAIDGIEERVALVGGTRNWHIERPGASNWTEARFCPVGKLGEEPPAARSIQNHFQNNSTQDRHEKTEPQAEWGKAAADENGTRLEAAQPDPAPTADTDALTPDLNRARPSSSHTVQ